MSTAQPQPSVVPQAVLRDVTTFERTLMAAARAIQMYSPHHPTAAAAAERCRASLAPLAVTGTLVIGVTPETLLVNGEALPADLRVHDAAILLNDRDILRMHIVSQPTPVELGNFLVLLSMDGAAIRQRGGPAAIWKDYGHYWLRIDQIDYDSLLGGQATGGKPQKGAMDKLAAAKGQPVNRDRVWQSLVRSMAHGRGTVEADADRRLLEIAQSSEAIRSLAIDAAASHQNEDLAALEATQAATILMTFQRLVSSVERHAPDELAEVEANVAAAAARMDPALLMRTIGEAAESGLAVNLVNTMSGRFDDAQVAEMLAAALTVEGKASARMAAALNTLVPDGDRRDRVLQMARQRASEVGLAAHTDVAATWATLEKFLAGPSDAAYVSQIYGASIEQAEARSHGLRFDAPAKLDEWVHTVSSESVRTLSATLLLDLFALERNPAAVL